MKTSIALLVLGAILGLVLASCGGDTTPKMQSKTAPASAAPPVTKAADDNAALDALRKVSEAQSTYFKVNRRYALSYDELTDARMLTSEPSADQTGYDFKLRPSADAQRYTLSAVPRDSSSTARRFFTDQTGVIHAETGKDATADSPVVK